jgi:hypothetical protein
MNERIKQLALQAGFNLPNNLVEGQNGPGVVTEKDKLAEFAELIIKDMANELFVVYPGGKRGSDVAFQNISMRQWIKQVYGVEE